MATLAANTAAGTVTGGAVEVAIEAVAGATAGAIVVEGIVGIGKNTNACAATVVDVVGTAVVVVVVGALTVTVTVAVLGVSDLSSGSTPFTVAMFVVVRLRAWVQV